MWETRVRTTISVIIADLHQEKPNWERMAYTVTDLVVEVGNQNLPSLVEPGMPIPMINEKACDICTELESLVAALSEKNAPKALEYAEAALLKLESKR
jgi:hypothetical protein